jgi:POT family proton-dependent oligopeptide transporter
MSVFGKFPRTFWVANSMEIFERMAWYGFYALSSLYITDSVANGGLGRTSEDRGAIQGIVTFLLYLFPILSGALGDKFGFKRMFFAAYLILTPGYFLLGLPRDFWGFFFVFLLVAVGAGTFKPVVVGTVGLVTTHETKALGFGIFYMMVNVGGFLGPLVAGYFRTREGYGWPWVFYLSSIWIACNFILLLLFYREPEGRERGLEAELRAEREAPGRPSAPSGRARGDSPAGQVLAAAFRLLPTFLAAGFLIGPLPAVLALGCLGAAVAVVAGISRIAPGDVRVRLRKTGRDVVEVLGNLPFFIMVMGTLILVMLARWIGWIHAAELSAILILGNLAVDRCLRIGGREEGGLRAPARMGDWRFVLYLFLLGGFWTEFQQLFLTMPEYIRDYTDTSDLIRDVIRPIASALDAIGLSSGAQGLRQMDRVPPEWIVDLDAGAIVLFQILISMAFARWKPFTTMVIGTLTASAGLAFGSFGTTGWLVSVSVILFGIGEMIASPKSQEYVARIAPPAKTAMYMGYYFVSIALGNLFGGLLSGSLYGRYGPKGKDDPATMWLIVGGIGVATAAALFLYDRLVIRRLPPAGDEKGTS